MGFAIRYLWLGRSVAGISQDSTADVSGAVLIDSW